jgi:membrane-bound serine protease (ClpP class)
MNFLIDPNVSYVLLILGFLTAILALFSPGTGVLEIAALIALALAGYGIANLPVNWWAFAIIALAVVPFVIALRQPRRTKLILMVAASLAFALGSAFLFRGEGWRPAVNPILILLLSPLAVGLSWIVSTKALEAYTARPAFDLNRLVGMTGQASSDIRGQGSVYVNGEEWTAVSQKFIPAGSAVRVVGREGLTLEVDMLEPFD